MAACIILNCMKRGKEGKKIYLNVLWQFLQVLSSGYITLAFSGMASLKLGYWLSVLMRINTRGRVARLFERLGNHWDIIWVKLISITNKCITNNHTYIVWLKFDVKREGSISNANMVTVYRSDLKVFSLLYRWMCLVWCFCGDSTLIQCLLSRSYWL